MNRNQVLEMRAIMCEKHLYGLDEKTENRQTRALVTFFLLNQALGSLCRVFMLKRYRRPSARYSLYRDQRVLFEGVLVGMSLGTGELVLALVEEHIWRDTSCTNGEVVLTEKIYTN